MPELLAAAGTVAALLAVLVPLILHLHRDLSTRIDRINGDLSARIDRINERFDRHLEGHP